MTNDLPDMTLEEAEKLWPETDYAFEAANQGDNPINTGDATAFFLEGYLYARKIVKENTLLLELADPIGAKTTTAKENNMSAENLNEEIMKADIAVKRGQAELLKAQTRRENAEAARVEKSVKE